MRRVLGLAPAIGLLFVIACGDDGASSPDAMVDAAPGFDSMSAVDAMTVNSAPAATDDTATTVEDTQLDIAEATLTSNDTDADGDNLTVTAVSNATNCTATLTAGVISVVPDANFSGDCTFDYEVSDGTDTDNGSVTVTVTPDWDTVAPQQINTTGVTCTTNRPVTGRKVAIDANRVVYGAMICGTEIHIVASTDLGETFGAPQIIDFGQTIGDIAIQGGPSGIAYLAITTSPSGEVHFARTIDSGATWSSPVLIDNEAGDTDISVTAQGDNVYIAHEVGSATPSVFGPVPATNFRVWRNNAQGSGAFTATDLVQDSVFFDVVVNDLTNDVWTVSDTPDLHMRQSTDGAVTFGAEVDPAPAVDAFYSDWAVGNGLLYVSSGGGKGAAALPHGGGGGTAIDLAVIDLATPTTFTAITGVIASAASGRAVTADGNGNVYVATYTATGAVVLDTASNGSTAIDDSVEVDAAGEFPGVTYLPGTTGAAVIYTKGTDVYISTQVFTAPPAP